MKNIFTVVIFFLLAVPVFSQTKGLSFDGADDFVSIPAKAGVLSGTAMTFEAWVKVSNFPGLSYVVSKGNSSYSFSLLFSYNDEGVNRQATALSVPALRVFLYNGQDFFTGQIYSEVSWDWVNQWHHVAVTYNSTTAILYVDGVLTGSTNYPGPLPATSDPVRLGTSGEEGFFQGTLDEVRIWNLVRTPEEIQAAMGKEIPANTAGLVAYYRLNEGTTDGNNTGVTTVTDLASSPMNGTLNNFALTGSTSNFTTGYTSLVTLPLKTASFIATRKESSIELNWKQSASDMPATFEVERSSDGTRFSKIGSATSKVTASETAFTFADTKPFTGINYYRLKIVEADNRSTYSNIVAARMTGNNAALQIYPVPARNSLQLEINAPKGAVDIRVRNLAGATIKSMQISSSGNTLFTSINVGELTKGTYLVQVNKESLLFIKQ